MKKALMITLIVILVVAVIGGSVYMLKGNITGNAINSKKNLSLTNMTTKTNITDKVKNKTNETIVDSEKFRIASWDISGFGDLKANDSELMNTYEDIASNYDIIFIQGIESESAFNDLCSQMNKYDCNVSSKSGRTSFQEQYGVLYRNTINMIEFKDYNPDNQDRWERPPIKATFDVSGYEFTAYSLNTNPNDVAKELINTEEIMPTKGDVILLGNLNADCSYYDGNFNPRQFSSWDWVIEGYMDTFVTSESCAFDRIVVNPSMQKHLVSSGIYSSGIKSGVSDHYLVWAEINTISSD